MKKILKNDGTGWAVVNHLSRACENLVLPGIRNREEIRKAERERIRKVEHEQRLKKMEQRWPSYVAAARELDALIDQSSANQLRGKLMAYLSDDGPLRKAVYADVERQTRRVPARPYSSLAPLHGG